MARIRTIKPEFFRNEELQDLEVDNPGCYAMLTFAGLWGHCDNKGRFEWRSRQLKLDILPFIPFDMERTLGLLESVGMIRRYESGGKQYGEIPTFEKHQRFSGKEATEGDRYPSPVAGVDLNEAKAKGSNGEATGKQRGSNGEKFEFHECPGIGKGKGIGREKEQEGGCKGETENTKSYPQERVAATASPSLDSVRDHNPARAGTSADKQKKFERFWDAYPLKKSKGHAKRAFARIDPNEQLLAEILTGIERAKTSDRRFSTGYIPHPATWLNGEGWKDQHPVDIPKPATSGAYGQTYPGAHRMKPAADNSAAVQEAIRRRKAREQVIDGECHEIN